MHLLLNITIMAFEKFIPNCFDEVSSLLKACQQFLQHPIQQVSTIDIFRQLFIDNDYSISFIQISCKFKYEDCFNILLAIFSSIKTCFTALNHSNTSFIILVLYSQNVYSVFIYTLCKYLALFALTCSVTTATIVENCVKFIVKIQKNAFCQYNNSYSN